MLTKKDITVEDLQDWLVSQDMTYAYSSRENKRLTSDLSGNLKVTIAGKTIYSGKSTFDAVRAYNDITEKYIDPNKDFRI